MSREGKKEGSSKVIFVIIAILLIAIAAGVTLGMSKAKNDAKQEITGETNEGQTPVEEVKTIQTYTGTDRPIAVMIDNNVDARPQAGINKAYMVYEIIVEGGETRLMALFKNVNVDKIGPVRSSRHYFLDYALEHDAIYVHFGWSPQAESDIKTLGVNNINGITQSGTDFGE